MAVGLLVLGVVAVVVGRPGTDDTGDIVLPEQGALDGSGPAPIVSCAAVDESRVAPCRRWTAALADTGGRSSEVVRAHGRALLLVADDGSIQRRDLATGRVGWRRAAVPGTGLVGVSDGVVLAVAPPGRLLLLDASSGRRIWTTEVAEDDHPLAGAGTLVRRARITTEAVYAVVGSRLVALDRSTGVIRWSWDDQHVLSAGVVGDVPYVVPVDGVVGLEPASGRVRWRVPLVTFDNRPNRAVGDHLVVGHDESGAVAIRGGSGEVAWRVDTAPRLVQGIHPVGTRVLLDLGGSGIVDVELASGQVRGSSPDGADQDLVRATDEVVVAVREERGPSVVALDPGHLALRWDRPLPSRPRAAAVRGPLVAALARDQLVGVDVATGAVHWRLAVARDTSLVETDDLLVLVADSVVEVLAP